MNNNFLIGERKRTLRSLWRRGWDFLCLDNTLIIAIFLLEIVGLLVLYSSSNQNLVLVERQIVNFIFAFLLMVIFAKIPVERYQVLIPWIYVGTILLLLYVAVFGWISKGGQRWINLKIIHLQPSELMKITVPMMLAWYLRSKIFPLRLLDLLICCAIIGVPALMIIKQPDLGTGILVTLIGCLVVVLTGIKLKIILWGGGLVALAAPLIWRNLYSYQKMRILIFLSPELDPYNKGYNILQSKIALGSGGLWGKGWLMGSQSHLKFLPESTTDFAFAVFGEEFGFVGCLFLMLLISIIIGRCLYISMQAQNTFSRLLSGGLLLSFFSACFVNIGMVSALLPVVGVPFPFISYGGSSLMIFMISFGVIMSVNRHRKLIES